ncbi:MAG TPA: hypothetical protein P5205_17665 [Candidatus Paceibacterota bacterium]|nr:hypothetical protein [Candidatus Paceibacterota bacterium]
MRLQLVAASTGRVLVTFLVSPRNFTEAASIAGQTGVNFGDFLDEAIQCALIRRRFLTQRRRTA